MNAIAEHIACHFLKYKHIQTTKQHGLVKNSFVNKLRVCTKTPINFVALDYYTSYTAPGLAWPSGL